MAEKKLPDAVSVERAQKEPTCGIIMPISATQNHNESHWSQVLKLLRRCISKIEMSDVAVWEMGDVDRISKKIIANIFKCDVVIADISVLNPNVMFELGMRMASKKPTIVICNRGCPIPFDIRDFGIIFYPGDLNIFDIENFSDELCSAIKTKYLAFKKDDYEPFLSDVVLEVVKPESREVSLDAAIADMLSGMKSDIERLSYNVRDLNRSYRSKGSVPPYSNSGRLEDVCEIEFYKDLSEEQRDLLCMKLLEDSLASKTTSNSLNKITAHMHKSVSSTMFLARAGNVMSSFGISPADWSASIVRS